MTSGSRTLSAIRWAFFAQLLAFAIQIPYTATMSRLLDAADFGVVALAAVLLRVISYLAQLGIQGALVTAESLEIEDYLAAQKLALFGALGACILVLIGTGVLAATYPSKELLAGVLSALSFDLLLSSFGVAALAELRRELRYRAICIIETVALAIGFLGVGVVTATLGLGPWALVAGTLCGSVLRATGYLKASDVPYAPFKPHSANRFLRRNGFQLSKIYFLEYWTGSADTLAIGAARSAHVVGIYSRASLLVWLPVQQVGVAVSRVLLGKFAALSTAQVGTSLRHGLVLVATAVCLPSVMLVAAGEDIVRVFFGPGWDETLRLLPFMAVGAVLNTLTQLPSAALDAAGLYKRRLRAQVVQAICLLSLLIGCIVLTLDSVFFASAWMLSEIVRHAQLLGYCTVALNLAWRKVLLDYLKICMFSGALIVVILLCQRLALPMIGVLGGAGFVLVGSSLWPGAPWRRSIRALELLQRIGLRGWAQGLVTKVLA